MGSLGATNMIRESLMAFTMITGANVADGVTTHQAMGRPGVVEGNSFVYGPRAERLVPVKALVVAAEFGIYHEIRKKNKKAAWIYVGTVVAGNLVIAYRNRGVR